MYRDADDSLRHLPKLLQRSREEGGTVGSYVFALELRRGGSPGLEGESPELGRWVFEMGDGESSALFLKSAPVDLFSSSQYGWQNLQVTVNRNGEAMFYVNGSLAVRVKQLSHIDGINSLVG